MAILAEAPSRWARSASLRKWVSRAFVVSIVVYLLVLGYLLAESVRGASRWAPYGVNLPTFVALIIGSEVIVTATAVWIFREDAGIWPASTAEGWRRLKRGSIGGLGQLLSGAWDVSIVDLRLRSRRAIALGRINRIAALAPLVYALLASANSAPWGLRTSALFDVAATLGVWAFMEIVMVQPQERAVNAEPARSATAVAVTRPGRSAGRRESRYEVRRLTRQDIPRLEVLERIKWGDQAASRAAIESRIARYPQGQLAAVHVSTQGGRELSRTVVAWCSVAPAREQAVRSFESWDDVTANGTIANCDPRGEVLVGVNLTSVTEGATYILLGEILASVVAAGKAKMIGGARLNGFVSFNERRSRAGKREFCADEYARLREVRGYHINEQRLDAGQPELDTAAYVELVNSLRSLNGDAPLDDDESTDYVCSNLRGYLSIPGARMVNVAAAYFPDAASDNWGVVIDWTNPLPAAVRHLPLVRGFAAGRIRKEVLAEWEERKLRVREKARRRSTGRERAATPEPVLA